MYGDVAIMTRSLRVRRVFPLQRHAEQHKKMWNDECFKDWKTKTMDPLISVDQWALDDDRRLPSSTIAHFAPHPLITK